MQTESSKTNVRDVVTQVAVAVVAGVVFLIAGWFAQNSLVRALLFVAAVVACGISMFIAFRANSTRLAAIGGAASTLTLVAAIALLLTEVEPRDGGEAAEAPGGRSVTDELNGSMPVTVAFEQPVEGAGVSRNGTTASGTLTGKLAEGESLWLFITSSNADGVHYMTDRVGVAGSVWTIPTGQVGTDGPEEAGMTFVLEMVLANSTATEAFTKAIADGDWGGWSELPEGASVVATRNVVRAPDELRVQITALISRDGRSGVSSAAGYKASGIAYGLLAGESLWLMDKDGNGYTIAQEVALVDHRWSAESYPVGDEGEDLHFTMGAAVVKADQECANALRTQMETDEYWLSALPQGCLEMDTESIEVTRP